MKCLKVSFFWIVLGLLLEVMVIYFRVVVYVRDIVLVLEDVVDWYFGDEVVIISGIGVVGVKFMEEIVIVEIVYNVDFYLRLFLRYCMLVRFRLDGRR